MNYELNWKRGRQRMDWNQYLISWVPVDEEEVPRREAGLTA